MSIPDTSRRAFLRGSSSRKSVSAIRPPWSLELEQFFDVCERCDDCIEVCPTRIIIRGDGGFPEVDLTQGECTFCEKCADVCKADAFVTEGRNTRNAWDLSVKIINSSCLSMNAVMCRICSEHCDTKAIRFQLKTGSVSIPEINHSLCTGCGVCLSACPVNAISIQNQVNEGLAT